MARAFIRMILLRGRQRSSLPAYLGSCKSKRFHHTAFAVVIVVFASFSTIPAEIGGVVAAISAIIKIVSAREGVEGGEGLIANFRVYEHSEEAVNGVAWGRFSSLSVSL